MSRMGRVIRSPSIDLRSFSAGAHASGRIKPDWPSRESKRNEVYVVNTGSSNVSVIDAEQNKVVATIGVYGRPYFIDVSPDGHRAYVANSGSDNVSVLDLDRRVVAATLRVGANPGLARGFSRWSDGGSYESRR